MELLGGLPGFASSGASAISADGTVVVGSSYALAGAQEAVRWTAGGAQGIGDLSGGNIDSHANAANADGSVIAGLGDSGRGIETLR